MILRLVTSHCLRKSVLTAPLYSSPFNWLRENDHRYLKRLSHTIAIFLKAKSYLRINWVPRKGPALYFKAIINLWGCLLWSLERDSKTTGYYGEWPQGCSLKWYPVDCKTVRIFAHSSTREQSHKGSGGRLGRDTKNKFPLASSVRIARFARVRKLLGYTKPIMRKEPTVCSLGIRKRTITVQKGDKLLRL